MAFNLYFAGSYNKKADAYLQERNALRLFSQVNDRRGIKKWTEAGKIDKLFIDSGAFSVAHNNKNVDIDKYIAYINSRTDIPIFVELDVIPYPTLNTSIAKYCAEKSWENYVYMKQRITSNCTLLPLYHFGEPKEALKRILNTEIDGKKVEYIGIGGRHGVSKELQDRYFNDIFAIISHSSNPNVKVHAFGMTLFDILEKYPFYSADSTTWLKPSVSGLLLLKGNWKVLKQIPIGTGTATLKRNLRNWNKDALKVMTDEIGRMGYNLEDLVDDWRLRMRYNIDAMLKWANEYEYTGKQTFNSNKLF